MSEMAPEETGGDGGSFLTRKVLGMPAFVWLALAAAAAYWYFSRHSSSSAAGAGAGSGDTGGSGTVTTGGTTVDTGAVQISVDTGGQDQPQPPTTGNKTTVAVPNVVGQRANTAIANLKKAGFRYKSSTGPRNPVHTYNVSSEAPKGGSKAAKGSVIDLAFKQN
jgi:hypothetical protein